MGGTPTFGQAARRNRAGLLLAGHVSHLVAAIFLAIFLVTAGLSFLGTMPTASASGGASTISTVAGSGTFGSSEPTLPGPAGTIEMEDPSGVAVDASGDLFISDQSNCVIWKVSAGQASVYAGKIGVCSETGDNAPATSASLEYPAGIALDSAGDLFMGTNASSASCSVREVAASTGTAFGISMTGGDIYSVAGNGTCGASEPSLPATSSAIEFDQPEGVAIDSSGNLYVADSANCALWEISGTTANVVAGKIAGCGRSGSGGPAIAAQMGRISGVAAGSGKLYLADPDNCIVWEVTSGNLEPLAGIATGSVAQCGYSGDGGLAAAATLGAVTGVAVDAAGDVFAAIHDRCEIREVYPSGYISTPVAAQVPPVCGFVGDGGSPTLGELYEPSGVALDSSGDAFIADTFNERVREATSAPAQVSSLSVGGGPTSGGTSVTITGSGFSWTTKVMFGSLAATNFSVISPTEITAMSPAQASSGAVDVTVGGLGGNSVITSSDQFVYSAQQPSSQATTTSLSASPNPAISGQAVALTASVTSSGSPLGVGTVTFSQGSSVLGSAQVTSAGVAVLSVSNLPVGSDSIDAVFSGSGTYLASTSPTLTVTVQSTSGGGGSSGGQGPIAPAAPLGSVSSQSSSNSSSTAVAAATDGGVTATGSGVGALTVAVYSSDPVGATTFSGPGDFFDVALSTANSFTALAIQDCSVGSGVGFQWWDPVAGGGAGAWMPVVGNSGPSLLSTTPPCISVDLGTSTSPTMAQMSGTVIAVSGSSTQPPGSGSCATGGTNSGSAGAGNSSGNGSGNGAGNGSGNGSGNSGGTNGAQIGKGYWEVASDGGLFSFGSAQFCGSMGGRNLSQPVVGMARTRDDMGYWEVASDGGLFAFGDAGFFGSMGAKPLVAPIVGMASTSDGLGYWEVASDGGLFAFGDAGYFGSMGTKPLIAPIVAVAVTPDGLGYWQVASDGGLFAFGDAGYFGSMGTKPLIAPIVAVAVTPDGLGYWEVASDGGLFAFGDAGFFGSMGGRPLIQPIVGMAAS